MNNVVFVLAGLVLLHLVHNLTGSLKEALISVYIFCWNPASVFFSSVYTESIYSFATFSGMLCLYKNPSSRTNQLLAALIFSIAFMTRSNGLLNIGYIGFVLLLETILRKGNNGKIVFEEFHLNFLKKVSFILSTEIRRNLDFYVDSTPFLLFISNGASTQNLRIHHRGSLLLNEIFSLEERSPEFRKKSIDDSTRRFV